MAGAAVAGRAARRPGRSPLCVAPAPRAAPAWARGRRRVLDGRPRAGRRIRRGAARPADRPALQPLPPGRTRCCWCGASPALGNGGQSGSPLKTISTHLGSRLLPAQPRSQAESPLSVPQPRGRAQFGGPAPCPGRRRPPRLPALAPRAASAAGAALLLHVAAPTGCHRLAEEPVQSAAGGEQESGG